MFERARYTIELLRGGYSKAEITELLKDPPPEPTPPAEEPPVDKPAETVQSPNQPPEGKQKEPSPAPDALRELAERMKRLESTMHGQAIREAEAQPEADPETTIIEHLTRK